MMARVSGIFMRTITPCPGLDCRSTVPPIFSMWVLTTSMPTPRPETLVHFFRGREARQQNQVHDLAIAQPARLVGGDQALLDRFIANPLLVETCSVIRDLDVDLSTFMECAQKQPPLRIFSCRLPDLGPFDAMVHGIPHDVGQRVFDSLDQRLVEFGLLAFHLHPHLLAARECEVAYGARQLAPDVADRLHS